MTLAQLENAVPHTCPFCGSRYVKEVVRCLMCDTPTIKGKTELMLQLDIANDTAFKARQACKKVLRILDRIKTSPNRPDAPAYRLELELALSNIEIQVKRGLGEGK